MSDFDSADVSPSSARYTEELNKDLGELLGKQFERSKKVADRVREGEQVREGLPPGYRMRADAHYVEQLSTRSADLPLRSIDVDEIADSGPVDTDSLEPLVRSIAAHGIVQPLLVRREGDGYRLIAGRKRLAAARAAKLSRVPCIVHQVDEAQARSLAEAEALSIGMVPRQAAAADAGALPLGLTAHMAETIGTIGSAAAMLAVRGTPMAQKVALDLVRAEAWRASWQLRAAALLDGTYDWQPRRSVLGAVVARACEGFASEARLKGINLIPEVPDWNLAAVVDEGALMCAITGAVIATAGLIEGGEKRAITVAVRQSKNDRLSIDVVQDSAAPTAGIDRRFFDPQWSDRPGGWAASTGVLVAKTVAERHGGEAVLVVRDAPGSSLQLRLGQ